jgi:hypothetical protein
MPDSLSEESQFVSAGGFSGGASAANASPEASPRAIPKMDGRMRCVFIKLSVQRAILKIISAADESSGSDGCVLQFKTVGLGAKVNVSGRTERTQNRQASALVGLADRFTVG